MAEAHANHFSTQQYQLAVKKNERCKEKLSIVQMLTMSKDMDEQLKEARETVAIVYHANRKICSIRM